MVLIKINIKVPAPGPAITNIISDFSLSYKKYKEHNNICILKKVIKFIKL